MIKFLDLPAINARYEVAFQEKFQQFLTRRQLCFQQVNQF